MKLSAVTLGLIGFATAQDFYSYDYAANDYPDTTAVTTTLGNDFLGMDGARKKNKNKDNNNYNNNNNQQQQYNNNQQQEYNNNQQQQYDQNQNQNQYASDNTQPDPYVPEIGDDAVSCI